MATGKILINVTNAGEYEAAGYRTGLWIHGGGYVMGSAVVDDAVCPA
ncbi:hypothetical protein [Lentzea alba]|nr:hypothetical protein [Lentzea alba]